MAKSKLRKAIKKGDLEEVRVLLNATTRYGDSDYLLNEAAQYGHLEIVKEFINTLSDHSLVNSITGNIGTAILISAKHGHLDIVKYLLGLNDTHNINQLDIIEALLYASLYGYIDIVRCLIGTGRIDNDKNLYTQALRNAADGGHLEIVKLMEETGDCPVDDHSSTLVTH